MSKNLVIIPTYNEKENIHDMIDMVMKLKPAFHLLVVDDNSPDGTARLVNEKIKQYAGNIFLFERKEKSGLGTAYITGFKWALERKYDYICEMDADFSHNPEDLPKLLTACVQGADLAIGSRYVSGVNVVNWPMGRVLLSYCASVYVRLITGMPFMDNTAGFKCYRKRVLKTILLNKINFIGYAFQIEMKFLAWKHGFKIVEIPIIFKDRKKGQSKMNTRILKEAIFGMVKLKIMSLFQKYEPATDDKKIGSSE